MGVLPDFGGVSGRVLRGGGASTEDRGELQGLEPVLQRVREPKNGEPFTARTADIRGEKQQEVSGLLQTVGRFVPDFEFVIAAVACCSGSAVIPCY